MGCRSIGVAEIFGLQIIKTSDSFQIRKVWVAIVSTDNHIQDEYDAKVLINQSILLGSMLSKL